MAHTGWAGVFSVSLALSCVGTVDPGAAGDEGVAPGGDTPGGPGTKNPPPGGVASGPRTALRRLTKSEIRNTVIDLVHVDPNDFGDFKTGWPEATPPYDTYADGLGQAANLAFTQAATTLADSVARTVAANDARRKAIVGCSPANAADQTCLRSFITGFGRSALRRPLEPDEIAALLAMSTAGATDFPGQVEIAMRAILRDPEFLYLVECGGCTRGASAAAPPADDRPFALGSFELASRLSYLIWGSKPDDELLAAALANALASPDAIRQQAARMLAKSAGKQALDRIGHFHGMWLGYDWPGTAYRYPTEMFAETKALLDRVIFKDKASWLEIFRSKETYVNAALAAHYGDGMQKPATGNAWVPYPAASGRQGILSHATFLSLNNKSADTSPTLRGKAILVQLQCAEMKKPDAATLAKLNGGKPVSTDPLPPQPGECKIDRYARSYLQGACAGCHNQIDPIGFGLENFDQEGRFRGSQVAEKPLANGTKPTCKISGDGKLMVDGELKPFKGPAGLSELLVGSEESRTKMSKCLATNLFRFAAGRPERPQDDQPFIDGLATRFQGSNFDLQDLVLTLVTAPGWSQRQVDGTHN